MDCAHVLMILQLSSLRDTCLSIGRPSRSARRCWMRPSIGCRRTPGPPAAQPSWWRSIPSQKKTLRTYITFSKARISRLPHVYMPSCTLPTHSLSLKTKYFKLRCGRRGLIPSPYEVFHILSFYPCHLRVGASGNSTVLFVVFLLKDQLYIYIVALKNLHNRVKSVIYAAWSRQLGT